MPTITLHNVMHVVGFEPNGKGRRAMVTEKAMHEYRTITEMSLPTHDASGLRHIRGDDFGLIVRGAWWILLQMACDSPRRGYLLRYAGDRRIEPLTFAQIGERLNVRPDRAEEICELLGPGCAGVLETLRRYELEIEDDEKPAYEAHRQGELFKPAATTPPRARTAAETARSLPPDSDLMRYIAQEWIAGKRKPLQTEMVARIAEALGPYCRGGRPTADDLLQWETMVVRCMTMPRRGQPGAEPLPEEIAVRISGVVVRAKEIGADCAVRGNSRDSIRCAPAVLAAWAREVGLLRGRRTTGDRNARV